ncbi:MAG: hypothetical protein Q9213_003287 [Squamulea squamosa]
MDFILSSGQDVLVSSFATSKDFLKKELSGREYEDIFGSDSAQPQPVHNIDTFIATLIQTRQSYEDRASSVKAYAKAKVWLKSLSARVVHYGNILDVLVQHHPEYVALAWGTFKILFVALQNHAELISKLSKHASRVAELLPQQKMILVLYPTSAMRETVAQLFASILKFFRVAIQFYKDSRLKHSIKAILHPWSLAFQDVYDEIATQAERVKELAALAEKAELRDAHIEILETRRVSNQVSSEIVTLKSTVQDLRVMMEQRMVAHGDLLTNSQSALHDIRLDLSQQQESIGRVHLNQLLSLPFWQRIPTSGESMEFCESMRRRRHKWSRTVLAEEKRLKLWAEEPGSSLLATQSYYPTTQKDFMVEMIQLLRDSQRRIVWALRFPDYWEADITVIDLLRMLVLQALQINASTLIKRAFPITLPQMREASTQRDWLNLLQQALGGLDRVFVALDMDLLSRISHNNREQVVDLAESLRTGLSTSVKLMASASSFDRHFLDDLQERGDCVRLPMNDRRGARRPPVRERNQRPYNTW